MRAADTIRQWRKDPVRFVHDNFKATPDLWQKDALEAYISTDPQKFRIAMLACAGP